MPSNSNEIPGQLKFLASHEWARQLNNGEIEIGISDHAQEALGELVYVELPEIGDELAAGAETAVVESVKAASDIYCPIAGTVTAVNQQLEESPDLVNQQPYTQGWLFRIQPIDEEDLAKLLDAGSYAASLDSEEE